MNRTRFVYGLHAVASLLRRKAALEVWVQVGRNDSRIKEIRQLANKAHVSVTDMEKKQLDQETDGARHQGVLAITTVDVGVLGLDDFLDSLTGDTLLLVLDGVQDPHNLGACLRTADAAGAQAVIIPKDRAVGLTPAARKVAVGAADHIPVIQVTNLARALKNLQERRIRVIGLAEEAHTSLFDTDLCGSLALVMGAEERGLRRLTKESCDVLVHLPMAGSVDSLNVSVAAGIALFEASRQQRISG